MIQKKNLRLTEVTYPLTAFVEFFALKVKQSGDII